MCSVLGIEVSPDLVSRWRQWFSPDVQPFRLDQIHDGHLPGDLGRVAQPTAEVRDTFFMYHGENWIWLTIDEYESLPLTIRRALLFDREALGRIIDQPPQLQHLLGPHRTGGRIVWWPSLLAVVGDGPIIAYIEEGVRPSRHTEVGATTWQRCQSQLPNAQKLAGSFANGSGPNCFGTVMGAAGVTGAEDVWMFQKPFEEWLASNTALCSSPAADQQPGTVLVWRDEHGLASHAAITIGDGYCLNKRSQSWSSPRLVWTVRDTITASRQARHHLTRYRLTDDLPIADDHDQPAVGAARTGSSSGAAGWSSVVLSHE